MIRYEYIEPTSGTDSTPVVVSRTRGEIVAEYYSYWSERMRHAGKVSEITIEHCIEDWCAIHWAERKDMP